MRHTAAVVLSLLVLPALALADFPAHSGYVNDFSRVLSETARIELDQLLRETEQQTTAEIAVAIVPSLDGMSVEEYANRLFHEWGIGKDKVDNGVLVLVAPNEREMRIEVGYGLEPVLPDGLAGEIIRTTFLPRFRNDDYEGGIRDGVARIAAVVKRKHVLTAEERAALAASDDEFPAEWILIPFLGLFVASGFFMLGTGAGSKTGFPILFGALFGGIPLVIALAVSFVAAAVLGPIAAFMSVLGFRVGRRAPAWVQQMRGESRTKNDGWVMGTSSDGSSSHSSSSSTSSSDSFGGGSSGGGGASGRW
jgi:uncharacterized protein